MPTLASLPTALAFRGPADGRDGWRNLAGGCLRELPCLIWRCRSSLGPRWCRWERVRLRLCLRFTCSEAFAARDEISQAFFRPFGARSRSAIFPRLAPWALFLRRFAAFCVDPPLNFLFTSFASKIATVSFFPRSCSLSAVRAGRPHDSRRDAGATRYVTSCSRRSFPVIPFPRERVRLHSKRCL